VKFLTRLWPRRRAQQISVTMAVQLVELSRPIPLSERQPGPDDFDFNHCWWGHWQGDHWLWTWDYEPVRDETHWLPATARLLPARCCPPEVHP
jgi:hypothetical protein